MGELSSEGHRVSDLPEIRLVTKGRGLPPRLTRAYVAILIVLSFVPGTWMIVGALTVGPDKSFALAGVFFVALAAAIWMPLRGVAREITIVGDKLSWQGYFSSGSALLRDLTAVRPATWPRAGLTFEVRGRRAFEALPARGIGKFVEALSRLRPDLPITVPRTLGWAAPFFGRADVTVSGSIDHSLDDK